MKKNKTWLFIIALLVVLIVILWGVGRKKGVFEKSYSDFAISDTASVTKIFLADKIGNSVLLSKDEAGIWMVNNNMLPIKTILDFCCTPWNISLFGRRCPMRLTTILLSVWRWSLPKLRYTKRTI